MMTEETKRETQKERQNHESVAGEWRPGLAQDHSWRDWESGSGSPLDRIESALSGAEEFLRDRFERQPYVTAGAALAAGFVLGRGMRSPLVRTLVGAGAKAAVGTLISRYESRDGE